MTDKKIGRPLGKLYPHEIRVSITQEIHNWINKERRLHSVSSFVRDKLDELRNK